MGTQFQANVTMCEQSQQNVSVISRTLGRNSEKGTHALATNSKNEGRDLCHSELYLSSGRKVLQFDTHEIKHHSNQQMRRDSIVPLDDTRIGLHY